jgi:hypothetical protein
MIPYNYRRYSGSHARTKKLRIGAAFCSFKTAELVDQRVTTTVAPTETRWYRSLISAFSIRMQP